MWCEIVLRLILAHVVGDFVLQTDEWCGKKMKYGLRGVYLYVHAVVIFILSWFGRGNCAAWLRLFRMAIFK